MKGNEYFKSPTKSCLGVSCAEAIKQHLIEKAYRLPYRGKPVFAGWEACNSGGIAFDTQEAALRHYFDVKAKSDAKHAERIADGPKANEVFRYRNGDSVKLVFGDGRTMEMSIREMRQRIFELTENIEIVDAN